MKAEHSLSIQNMLKQNAYWFFSDQIAMRKLLYISGRAHPSLPHLP